MCTFGTITRALEWTMVCPGENTRCSNRSLVQSQSTSAMVCSGVTLRPVIHWEEGRGTLARVSHFVSSSTELFHHQHHQGHEGVTVFRRTLKSVFS